jgi:hypothetical protein
MEEYCVSQEIDHKSSKQYREDIDQISILNNKFPRNLSNDAGRFLQFGQKNPKHYYMCILTLSFVKDEKVLA